MSENEAIGWVFLSVLMGMLFCGIRYVCTTNERMARDGYSAYQLTGSTDIYWYKQASKSNCDGPVKF